MITFLGVAHKIKRNRGNGLARELQSWAADSVDEAEGGSSGPLRNRNLVKLYGKGPCYPNKHRIYYFSKNN